MQPSCSNQIAASSNASNLKPCSSKATSVIRLASPKSICTSNAIPVETAPSRSMIKAPYNKQPKKLVVKLKKPFVPVIGEEANLHPPEMSLEQAGKPVKIEKLTKDDVYVSNNNQNHSIHDMTKHEDLECSEEVPFSPLRQSYTPVPVNHLYSTIAENVDANIANNPIIAGCSSLADDFDQRKQTQNYNSVKEQGENNQKKLTENESSDDIDNYTVAVNTAEDDGNEGKVLIFSISSVNEETNEQNEDWCNQKTTPSSPSTRSNYCDNVNETDRSVYYVGVSTSSEPANSSQSEFSNTAGTSRVDYGVPNFLGYNENHTDEYLYSGVSLSPNNNWNQRFSPQYAPFEADKNSYMDLDLYKNTSTGERAPSTDSLNIRTDEKMPAKGEISEQESNGDIDGSWSHQVNAETVSRFSFMFLSHFLCL